MANVIWLAVLSTFITISGADFPLDPDLEILTWRNDEAAALYRIPEVLDPVHFEVEITPYFDATADRDAFSFDGIVTINVTAVADGITELILHDNVREILGLTVTDNNGNPILLNETRPFERLREYQFLKIYLRDGISLVNGANYIIRIVYIGHMNETPLSRGMFRGSYVGSDGRRHWYAATHLQPTHSRQLMPSFDEPGFKSTFTIIVNRLANYTDTFSNMQIAQRIPIGDRVKEIFYPTPRMSAYLISIHISEEFTVINDNNDSARSYRIIARPNAQGQGDYAQEVGPPLTEWLGNYLGVPYYTMGENMKNDQIALPDWASGATENWGLVSYREVRLLYEEGETSFLDKKYVATITAHELAHKWFGNLVTCRWWENVWINEGYASYFEYFAMAGVDETMELEDQFNVFYLQSALSTDSSANTRALQHTVNTPEEVTGHFSGISYTKGASLLMMLRHWLSDQTFRKSLNYYLVEMAYEHAYPADVYRNFERAVQEDNALTNFPNVNITEFLDYWVDEPGYPILNVDINVDTGVMSLSQERFLISPTAAQTNQVWTIPLSYTTQNNPNWDDTSASHVITGRTDSITKAPADEWVIFNVKQTAFYRVNYNEHNWILLANALRENPSSIHHLNRAQIADDVFALMRSERMTYALGFNVLDFLRQETSFFVWYPAITGLNSIRNRLLHLPEALAEYESILYNFLDSVINNLGYDVNPEEPLTTTLNRFYILSFACNVGHQGCINDAISKFSAFYNNGVSVNPNLRRHVYCTGLLNGGYSEWSFLQQRMLAANNQASEVAILRALGCTTNDQAIQEYLEMVLTSSVKAQDRVNAFTFLFMGDRGNARKALPFFRQNVDTIRDAVVGSSRFSSVLSNLASYMDEEGLVEMEQWLIESQASIPEYAVGISAVNSARSVMAWGDANVDEILAAARDSAITVVPTVMVVLMALVAVVMK